MRVTRTMPDAGWVPVANAAARDHRLSWRAKGLLLELLSYPDGWDTNVDKLVALGRRADGHAEGRDAMRTAMTELVQFGYVRRLHRGDERGRWTTDLEVSDRPTENPASVDQSSVLPSSADRASETQSVTKETDTNTVKKTDQHLETANEYSESLASLAVVAAATTRDEEIQLELKQLYDQIDEMAEDDRRRHLLSLERRRPRIYRECRNEAIRQIKRDEPRTLKTDRAVPVIDRLSYKYAALHYAHSPTGVPAWFRRPLEGLS